MVRNQYQKKNWIHKYEEIKQHILKNQWVKGEIKSKIRKYTEIIENENTKYQNEWDTVKAVVRRKFTVVNAYVKKEGNISNQ